MTFETIRVEVGADRVATLELHRPEKRNAISIVMRREVSACLASWADDGAVGAVVLTGSGSVLSSGFDLEEFQHPDLFDALFETSSRYHRDVWNFPKPLIAAVNGPAMGGGFDLVLLCDVRIGCERASFGHPEIKFGAPPLYTPLRSIIGEGRARELCLTGRRIDATEAHRLGLLSEVVGDAVELLPRANALARTILEAPDDALQFTKGFFVTSPGARFDEWFQVEHDKAFRQVLLPRMAARVGSGR